MKNKTTNRRNMDTEIKTIALYRTSTSEMDNTHSRPETHTRNGNNMETIMGRDQKHHKSKTGKPKTSCKKKNNRRNTSSQTQTKQQKQIRKLMQKNEHAPRIQELKAKQQETCAFMALMEYEKEKTKNTT